MVRRVWRRRGGRRNSFGPFDRLGGPVDGLSGLITGFFFFFFLFGVIAFLPLFLTPIVILSSLSFTLHFYPYCFETKSHLTPTP